MAKKSVFLSVVIPIYNVERYVRDAVESICSQLEDDVEVLLIDDGSTDNSVHFVEDFINADQVRLFRTENRGLGAARNLGIEKAQGEFLYFFDSDDVLAPNFFSAMRNFIYEGNPDIIAFSGECFVEEDCHADFFPSYSRNLDAKNINGESAIIELSEVKGFFSSACQYVSRASFWGPGKILFPHSLHEDEAVLYPLFSKARKVTITTQVFFFRRIRAGSIMTSDYSLKNFEGIRDALLMTFKFYRDHRAAISSSREVWIRRIRTLALSLIVSAKRLRINVPWTVLLPIIFRFWGMKFFARVIFYSLPLLVSNCVRSFFGKRTVAV